MADLARFEVERRADVMIVSVTGEIDASNASQLRERMERDVPNDVRGVVLELSEIRFIDSSGMELLFELQSRLERHALRLHVVLPQHAVIWRTLEIAGFRLSGRAFPDLESALASLDPEDA